MPSETGLGNNLSIIPYSAPIFSSNISTSAEEIEKKFSASTIVAVRETTAIALNSSDVNASNNELELEADLASRDVYSNPILTEVDFALTRVVKILDGMTEEERRILLAPIEEGSLEPDSILFLKDKEANIPITASDFFHVMLRNWPNEINRDHVFDQKFSIRDTEITKHVPNIPLPKRPLCFGKMRTRVQWALTLSLFALIAIICATLFIVLNSNGSENGAKPFSNNFTIIVKFQNSITTTGLNSNNLRFDHRLQRAFISDFPKNSIRLMTWDGRTVQNFQFDRRQIFRNFKGIPDRQHCSTISITTNNKPVLFCTTSRPLFDDSSWVVNAFESDDQWHEFRFPGKDSMNMIELVELQEADNPTIWYSMKLRCNNTAPMDYAGVGFGYISASDRQYITKCAVPTNDPDIGADISYNVYAMRVKRSDKSVHALIQEWPTFVAGICRIVNIKNNLTIIEEQNCTNFENLYGFIIHLIGATSVEPSMTLEPPRAMFVQGRYLKGQEWTRIWVVYAVTGSSNVGNWSPVTSFLHLALYSMGGKHIGNVVHSTTDEIQLSQQTPTGQAVVSTDSMFVSFYGRNGSSVLARYTFTVCFDDESFDCSPLEFEI